jgi:WD40 repeat protein
MSKHFIIILVFLSLNTFAFSQNEINSISQDSTFQEREDLFYEKLMQRGDKAFAASKYSEAYKHYLATARSTSRWKNISINKTATTFQKIDSLRIAADSLNKEINETNLELKETNLELKNTIRQRDSVNNQLVRTNIELDTAKQIAIKARDSAVIARNEAILQKSKVEANFLAYRAEQEIFDSNYTEAYDLASKARLKIDSLITGEQDSTTTELASIINTYGRATFYHKKEAVAAAQTSIPNYVISPSGQYLLFLNPNNSLALSSMDGRPLKNLKGHKAPILKAIFSANEEKLLTCSADGTAKLWSLGSNKKPINFDEHTEDVLGGTFLSEDSNSPIITWSRDNKIYLWNAAGEKITSFEGHSENVYDVAVSPKRDKIITRSSDRTVKLWDIKGKLLKDSIQHQSSYIYQSIFAPNNGDFLTCSADSTVVLWDSLGNKIATLFYNSIVNKVQFSNDGHKILTISLDSTLTVWERKSLSGVQKIKQEFKFSTGINEAWFSENGSQIITCLKSNKAHVWDLSNNSIHTLKNQTEEVLQIRFSKNEQFLLTYGINNNIKNVKIWDAKSKIILMDINYDGPTAPQFFPDGNYIITSNGKNEIIKTPISEIHFTSIKNKSNPATNSGAVGL